MFHLSKAAILLVSAPFVLLQAPTPAKASLFLEAADFVIWYQEMSIPLVEKMNDLNEKAEKESEQVIDEYRGRWGVGAKDARQKVNELIDDVRAAVEGLLAPQSLFSARLPLLAFSTIYLGANFLFHLEAAAGPVPC